MEKMYFDADGKWLGWTSGDNCSIDNAVHSVEFNGKFDSDLVYSLLDGQITSRVKTSEEVDFEKQRGDIVLAEGKLNSLRTERNKRLAETDYWAYQDRPPMTDQQKTYRQALRDITNSYSSIDTVVWPTKP
jgi:hypothetical protein